LRVAVNETDARITAFSVVPVAVLAAWDRVPLARRTRGLQVLDAFGLDGVDGDGTVPVGHGAGTAVPLPEAG
jgi:hypothetical protein